MTPTLLSEAERQRDFHIHRADRAERQASDLFEALTKLVEAGQPLEERPPLRVTVREWATFFEARTEAADLLELDG